MKNILNESRRGESCSTCRYYLAAACRFLSPVTLDGKAALFPPMAATGWCGRWKKTGNKAATIVQPTTSARRIIPVFDWEFFRGPFSASAPSEDKALGYNRLFNLANDLGDISKLSFNLVIQKALARGELKRVEQGPMQGCYWVTYREPKAETVPTSWY